VEQAGFDPRYHAVVPISYLDRLLRCYYGHGPRDGETIEQFKPENPSTEVVGGFDLKGLDLVTGMPKGFSPKGVAKRKQEAANAHRHDSVTEGQDISSEGN